MRAADLAVLDDERVPRPLVWRLSTVGDRFRPLGMARAKKLGDFFTDEKVPRAERGAAPIVSSADAIVWVVGHRQADWTKVTESTRRVLWLEASRGGEP